MICNSGYSTWEKRCIIHQVCFQASIDSAKYRTRFRQALNTNCRVGQRSMVSWRLLVKFQLALEITTKLQKSGCFAHLCDTSFSIEHLLDIRQIWQRIKRESSLRRKWRHIFDNKLHYDTKELQSVTPKKHFSLTHKVTLLRQSKRIQRTKAANIDHTPGCKLLRSKRYAIQSQRKVIVQVCSSG